MAAPSGSPPSPTEQQLIQGYQQHNRRLDTLEQAQKNGSSNNPLDPTKAESRSLAKPARVIFNGKEYEIIVENHGQIVNPDQAQSQRFATLFGMTLQYGIAALIHKYNLSEKEIKLKYINIKKKVGDDGKLFITYNDQKKGQKCKVEINHCLEIDKPDDKKRLQEDLPKEGKLLTTALDTHKKAIEFLEAPSTNIGSKEGSQGIGSYELNIPKNLSNNSIEYLDNLPTDNYPKDLKSKTNDEKNQNNDPNSTNTDTDKSQKNSEKSIETPSEAKKSNEEEESPRPAPVDVDDNNNTENAQAINNSSNATNNPSETTTAPETAKATETDPIPEETSNPWKISEEENHASKIPDFLTDDSAKATSWINYLFKGQLTSLPIRSSNIIKRTINPVKFNLESEEDKQKIVTIFDKICNNPSIDNFKEDEEKVFLKRLALLLKAYKENNRKKEFDKNQLSLKMEWIVQSLQELPNNIFTLEQTVSIINNTPQKKKATYKFINSLFEKIETGSLV